MQKKFCVYKPNKRLAGAAVQFDLNAEKESVFVEAANQTGEQLFDWSKKITVKLALTDISKLLLVLDGKTKSIELFHDSTKTKQLDETNPLKNTAVSLAKGDYGFFLKLSRQYTNGQLSSVNVPLSDDEALALGILFKQAIIRFHDW